MCAQSGEMLNRRMIMVTFTTVWAVAAAVTPARGTPVTWSFKGEITSVTDFDNVLGGAVSIGTSFFGSLTFESNTPDSNPDPAFSSFENALIDFSGMIGAISFGGPIIGVDSIYIANGVPSVSADTLSVFSTADLAGQTLSAILNLTDLDGTALSSDALPVVPPDLSQFDSVTLRFMRQLQDLDLKGDITLLTPDPGTLCLLGIGAASLLRRRRR